MTGSARDDAARFVRALYLGILRREPDAEELARWSDTVKKSVMSAADIAEAFLASEEFRTAQSMKFFVPAGHVYSPIVNPSEAERHFASQHVHQVPDALADVVIDRAQMVRTWNSLLPFLRTAPFPEMPSPGFRYAYENPAYSYGDGTMLHAILRRHKPKRVVEIGSGWSSACTLDTVEKYLNGACELTFIDPYPRLLRDLIRDAALKLRILECNVQEVPLKTFEALEAGDVLFIDSTHVLRTGSDVCFELFDILPRLRAGVVVHFHDIFWPFEYPRAWVIDENRSWNELYAIRAFLMHNTAWNVVMFNDYFAKLERKLIEVTFPQFMRNSGGALWLTRREA